MRVRVIDRQQFFRACGGVPEGVEKLLRGCEKGRSWRLRLVGERYSTRHQAVSPASEKQADTFVGRAAARVRPQRLGYHSRYAQPRGDDGRG